MSNFEKYEQLVSVYKPVDNNSTKVTIYNSAPEFSIKIHIIQRSDTDTIVMGDVVGDYVANVNAQYENASGIKQGDKIVSDTFSYKVINEPRYNKLFDRYKLNLKRL